MKIRSLILACCLWSGAAFAADTPEDLIAQAQQLENGGSVQKAVGLYEQFVKEYPGHSQALEAEYRLGRCYDSLGDVDQAIAHLKIATETAGKGGFRNRPEALLLLGKLQGSLKEYDAAIKTFEKLLGEGAGLYEDEVMNLCAGYYAIREKYDDAAAKFNILRRKGDSKLAEQAAYKLAILWLKAGKMDLAVNAIQELAQQFPANNQIPELLLKAADAFRQQKDYAKTISIADQLRSRYPKTVEAVGAAYLLGLCYREQKDPKKAVEILDKVTRGRDASERGLAAEALLASADIYQNDLQDAATAIQRYEEAAKTARDSDSPRKSELLEQCYFRIAEHHFAEKNWSVALENYSLLRDLGTGLNVSGRILECQSNLGKTEKPAKISDAGVDALKAQIAQNPGTATAAEGEVFLLDRQLGEALEKRKDARPIAAEYAKLLPKYSKDILAADHLAAYVHSQIGTAFRAGETGDDWIKAVAAFEKAIAFDSSDSNPYKIPALENIAALADRLGDKPRALKAYTDLFDLTKEKLAESKEDKAAQQKTLDYMKSIATRSESGSAVNKAIEMTKSLIEEQGALSNVSAQSRFYLGELYLVKKDYSAAAAAFQDLIKIHGPPQDESGELTDAPWKPTKEDTLAELIFDAASRMADAWYLQGHMQNMAGAYQWIARNIPNGNKHMAQVQYWLAMEESKGKDAKSDEARRKLAEALWLNVVGNSFEFAGKDFKKTLHPWVPGNADSQKYVKAAMLKSAQIFGELDEHERAAGILSQFLVLYPDDARRTSKPGSGTAPDEMGGVARYALGREYLALGEIQKAIETYEVYTKGMRDDRLRVSALKLLAFHAGQAGVTDKAIDAYATLLDEYGANPVNPKTGEKIPAPRNEWLRSGNFNWDGFRMDRPKDLDQGEIRFALGFLYWNANDWTRCVQALAPFLTDKALAANRARPKALYMSGQSHAKMGDHANTLKVFETLIKDHPNFEAIEEVYVRLAGTLVELKRWVELEGVERTFLARWPQSSRRDQLTLYSAVRYSARGDLARALLICKMLADGEAFENVKSEAAYYTGAFTLEANPKNFAGALPHFEKSIALMPNARACLQAAKCYQNAGRWEEARNMADRVIRDFPGGDPRVVGEARNLLPNLIKEVVKKK